MFVTKNIIHTTLVDAIYNEILSRRSNYYYFIGRVLPWDTPLTPESPIDTRQYEYNTRNAIVALKKVQTLDVSYVVPRRDWVSGTVYDQFDENYSSSNPAYSGATSLKNSSFYVLSSANNVYKCLFNNNNAASTIQPTGTDLTPLTTADGYIWKYMYSIPLSLANRFLTDDLMPVSKAVFNPFYSNGEVDRVNIDSRGSGYIGNTLVSLTVDGIFNSTLGNVVANIIPVFSASGQIQDIIIRNAGNNYQSANIIINDAGATGNSYYFGIREVIINNAGSGYFANVVANTTIQILTSGTAQPTSNAIVNYNFNNNSLVSITIINGGTGYKPNVSANTFVSIVTTGNDQPATNATASLRFSNTAILEPVFFNGVLDRVLIKDPGIGYKSNLQTSIIVTGDGSGANLLPFVNESGELEDVIILNRGSGYSYIDAEIVGDGTGANVSVDLSTGDLDTLQAAVELSAIDGGIYAFNIDTPGNNYSSANISIIGDGTGFVGNVIISNTNSISRISISSPGSGYTFANVIITGNGSNANVSAILSPVGGHGKDAIKELFADTLIFYSTVNNDRIHGVDVQNDYRQFGLIKDVEIFGAARAFANINGTPLYLATFNTLTDSTSNTIQRDTVLELVGNTFRKFEVVEVVTSNTRMLLNSSNNYQLAAGDVLNDPITDSNFTVQSIDRSPTINKFSGDMLFIDNRTSVSYSDNQIVTLRTVLKL